MDLLARLPAHLGPLNGEPVPLEGGITNRNFRVRLGEDDYVLRVCGEATDALGIDRACEVEATALAARLGIGPEVVASFTEPPALLTRFIDGDAVDAEALRTPERTEQLAGALRAYHDSGAELPTTFDCFRVVEAYAAAAAARGRRVPAAYAEAYAWAREIEEALTGPEHAPVPIHADLLAANLLVDRTGALRIVDWEYAGMGDRYFDLGNAAVNNRFEPTDEARLLTAYFGEPPSARRRAALALMRIMSDFREAMWAVVQGAVSTLDFDFDAYAEEHLERLRTTARNPEFEVWLQEARGTPA